MARYRAAVIGLGRMGSTYDDGVTRAGPVYVPYAHGPSYHHSLLVNLVAGADIHPEQRSLFGERWGLSGDHLYSDFREMLEKEQLDIVSVCTTARHRAAIVQHVARAGVKAIWAEKPMCLSLEEADAMVRVCQENGVRLAVNCSRRWHPLYTEAKSIIEAGEIGDTLQVTAYAQCRLSSSGSHSLDAVRMLAGGDVRWVFGEIESDDGAARDDDPAGNGYLAFDNGVRAYVRSMECGAAFFEFDVLGSKGRIRLLNNGQQGELIRLESAEPDGRGFRSSSRGGMGLPAKYIFPMPARMQGLGLTIVEDLVDAIEEGRPPLCSGEDGRAALETAIAMRESHRRGGVKVALPLEDRSLKVLSSEILGDDVPRRIRGWPELHRDARASIT